MNFSQSYNDMVSRITAQSFQEGNRPYPVAGLEIFLLNAARERMQRKEADLFQQLTKIFDWKMTRKRRNHYLKSLNAGFTLVLTDLNKTILWASHNFLTMTGYRPAEVLSLTPALLQGPDTDPAQLRHIRACLRQAEPVGVDLLNYRKCGEAYLCRIEIEPMYNGRGELTHFLAVEREKSH